LPRNHEPEFYSVQLLKGDLPLNVSELAKELGLNPSAILGVCEKEQVPNISSDSSRVSAGLAATIREWFAAGFLAKSIGQAEAVTPSLPPSPNLSPPRQAMPEFLQAAQRRTAKPAERSEGQKPKRFEIKGGEIGWSYEEILRPYLDGTLKVTVEEPYLCKKFQLYNFVRFCEVLAKQRVPVKEITLLTKSDSDSEFDLRGGLSELKSSLQKHGITLIVETNPELHDREIRLDDRWIIQIGHGLHYFQEPDANFALGASDFYFRKCKLTKVTISSMSNFT
jgi:ATP-dependent Lon protease